MPVYHGLPLGADWNVLSRLFNPRISIPIYYSHTKVMVYSSKEQISDWQSCTRHVLAIFPKQNKTYYADLWDGQQLYSPTASTEQHNSFSVNKQ